MYYDFNLILEADPIICDTRVHLDNNNYSRFYPFVSI